MSIGARAALVIATALPILLVAGVITLAVRATHEQQREPLQLAAVPAPAADSPECRAVLAALPETLGDYRNAVVAEPVPPATRAWRHDNEDLVVLRCGLERPMEFDRAAPLQLVDGVQWFAVSGHADHLEAGTWYAVDRGVYLALTVPDNAGPTPLQEISDLLTRTLPARPLDPRPLPN